MLGLLRSQVAVTLEGLDAFGAWAAGDPAAAQGVRDAERRGDAAKRELLTALRAAFVTPLEPEDVFALSRGIDRLLNHARELINESDAMACPPDARIAEMASLLAGALRHIDTAIVARRHARHQPNVASGDPKRCPRRRPWAPLPHLP